MQTFPLTPIQVTNNPPVVPLAQVIFEPAPVAGFFQPERDCVQAQPMGKQLLRLLFVLTLDATQLQDVCKSGAVGG